MNVVTIALKSIKQRLLASSLTGLSVALGVMLMVGVLVAYSVIDDAFQQRSIGYNFVVGRKGSDIQLVLSTVYRIGNPPDNLPYRYYLELLNNPYVKDAVPIAMGDTTEQGGFPLVGTTREYFMLEYAPGQKFQLKPNGRGFEQGLDAIIGSKVAEVNGWTYDDPETSEDEASTFKLVHGGADSGGHVHNEKFRVVSILKETGTANDRTVFIYLGGFYAIAGHETPMAEAEKREREFFGNDVPNLEDPMGDSIPLAQKEVTAILVNTRGGVAGPMFAGAMRKSHRAQAANPIEVMRTLMDLLVGKIKNALLVMTGVVIVVSGVSIFVSIYNSMSDRKKEIAIMRALGAQRRTVFAIILIESIILCFGGGILGGLCGHALIVVGSPYVESSTGLMINPWTFHPAELWLLPAMVLLATLVGFIPGMTAYRTDVARTLAD
jgi:putative ABC transport system permease protein